MRRWIWRLGIVLLGMAPLALAGSARAAQVEFTGELSLAIGDLPAFSIQGSGIATVNASSAGGPITQLVIPAGVFSTSVTLAVPNAFPIVGIGLRSVVNPTISVQSSGGCTKNHPLLSCPGTGLAGFAGLSGAAVVGVFSQHSAASGTQPVANLVVPLGVVGGASTVQTDVLGLTVIVSGAGWTTGTAAIYSPTAPYYLHFGYTVHVIPSPTAYASESTQTGTGVVYYVQGTRNTSPGSGFDGGALSLVTPIQIFATGFGFLPPSFVSIRIELMPEPHRVLGMAAAALAFALIAVGRSRR